MADILLIVDNTGGQNFKDLLSKHGKVDVESLNGYDGATIRDYKVVILSSDGTVLDMKQECQTEIVEAVRDDAIGLIVFEFASFCVSNGTLQILKDILPLSRVSGWTESVEFTDNSDFVDENGFLAGVRTPFNVYMSGSITTLNSYATCLLNMKGTSPAVAQHNDHRIVHFTMCPVYVSANYFSNWSNSPLRTLFDNVVEYWLYTYQETKVGNVDSNSLLADMAFAMNDDAYCDITFKTSDGQYVKGNRWFLSLRSEVLRDLLDGSSPDDVVEVDSSYVAFKAYIEHMYKEQSTLSSLTVEQIIQVLQLADKYHNPQLVIQCEVQLTSMFSLDNILQIVMAIPHPKSATYRNKLRLYLFRNYKDIVKRKDYKTIEELPEYAAILENVKTAILNSHKSKPRTSKDKCLTM